MYYEQLSSGVNIFLYPIKTAYSIAISLCTSYGSAFEDEQSIGITHLLEHMFFRRLGKMTQSELYQRMEEIGGTLNAVTYKDMIRFSMKVRPQYLAECLQIFKEIVVCDQWSQSELESERKIVLNELSEKNSYMDIDRVFDEFCFKGSSIAYPTIGTEESIMNITVEDINAVKNTLFSFGNINLVVAGKIEDESKDIIMDAFENVNLDVHPKIELSKPLHFHRRKPDIKLIDTSWEFVDIKIGFDVNLEEDIKEYEVKFLNSILGGGIGSVLQREIREKLGLSSNIYSEFVILDSLVQLRINFSVDKADIYRSILAVITILNNMKQEIEKRFYDSNIIFFTDNLWFYLENPEWINEDICWHNILSPNNTYSIKSKIKNYSGITLQRLVELSKKIFEPNNTTIVIMGNTKKITIKEIKNIVNELHVVTV